VFAPICLPRLPSDTSANPADRIRLTRTFRFDRTNGQSAVNNELMDCTRFRFTVQRNTAERWILRNSSGGWQHPIHPPRGIPDYQAQRSGESMRQR
jgi:FtsP/CotA-like multicopper oxidase with cupredoxin domain